MTSQEGTPTLSICIPTYNRASYLRDALESITRQLTDNSLVAGIEVVVADNASTDDTRSVVHSFKDKIAQLIYVRNDTNVGFDRNVDIAVRHAHGIYCWYLGDDDLIVNGALAHMLTQCTKDAYTIISTTSEAITDRATALLNPKRDYTDSAHQVCNDPNECYVRGYYPSALSFLAFRRDAWLRAADSTDYTPDWFYFEAILRLAIAAPTTTLHITTPMVLTGQDMRWADNGGGLGIYVHCNMFLRRMTAWGYDKARTERELADNARQFPLVLLQAKARDLPLTRKNFAIMRSYSKHIPWYLRTLGDVLFYIPNILIKTIRNIKKIIV